MSDIRYRLWLDGRYELARDEVVAKATEMGIFDDPWNKSTEELTAAIKTEQTIIDFDTRLQRQTPERQSEVIRELRLKLFSD